MKKQAIKIISGYDEEMLEEKVSKFLNLEEIEVLNIYPVNSTFNQSSYLTVVIHYAIN